MYSEANDLTGEEWVIIEQDGVLCKVKLYKFLSFPTPTIAAAPTSFLATVVSDTEIDLTWSGSADNYVLESCRDNDRAWVEIYSGATAAYSNIELTGEEHYYYRVKSQVTGEFDSDWATTDETTDAPV